MRALSLVEGAEERNAVTVGADGAGSALVAFESGREAVDILLGSTGATTEAGVASGEWGRTTQGLLARAYVAMAIATATMRRRAMSAEFYQAALELLEASPHGAHVHGQPVEMEIIAAGLSRAKELSRAGQHAEATVQLEHVRLYRPTRRSEDSMHFDRTMLLAEGGLLRCAGRLEDSAESLRKGLALSGQLTGSGTAGDKLGAALNKLSRRETLSHMNTLVEVLAWSGREQEADAAAREMAVIGGWPDHRRRPVQRFVPSLDGGGWLRAEVLGDAVVAMVASLRAAHAAIRQDFLAVRRAGLLSTQSECLHDPSLGRWSYFGISGDLGPRGCAPETPAACRWLSAQASGGSALVRRVGFSVVEPHSHIRAHTGPDNTLLKIHLGIRVPAGGCATFTIAGERRAWAEGDALVFDDTYEHEVWNNCSVPRVVLQVVFAHPAAERAMETMART